MNYEQIVPANIPDIYKIIKNVIITINIGVTEDKLKLPVYNKPRINIIAAATRTSIKSGINPHV